MGAVPHYALLWPHAPRLRLAYGLATDWLATAMGRSWGTLRFGERPSAAGAAVVLQQQWAADLVDCGQGVKRVGVPSSGEQGAVFWQGTGKACSSILGRQLWQEVFGAAIQPQASNPPAAQRSAALAETWRRFAERQLAPLRALIFCPCQHQELAAIARAGSAFASVPAGAPDFAAVSGVGELESAVRALALSRQGPGPGPAPGDRPACRRAASISGAGKGVGPRRFQTRRR